MKGVIIILTILGLLLFAVMYGFILYKSDYGVMNYDTYIYNPPCEFKQLEDGWTQIPDCAVYKINLQKFIKR